MKTILLKKTSTFISVIVILILLFSSCKKSSENAATTAPVAPLEFVNFIVDNIDTTYTSPSDSIILRVRDSIENNMFNNIVGFVAIHRQAADSNFVVINFSGVGIAQGSAQPLHMIIQTHFRGLGPASPINVNITQYGALPGEFIAGNFNGQMIDLTGVTHTVSCNFKVQRDY